MNIKIYKPEMFQGNLKEKNYFEGWYFKHVSHNLQDVYSFIPGVSLNEYDSHAFIQVINGITGKSDYIRYSLDEFKWDRKRLFLTIGDSVFTENHIKLMIKNDTIKVEGHLSYRNNVKYPRSLFSPGIMGWYSFVPFMECKHGIISVNHDVKGSIKVNNDSLNFNEGKGYMEKDWGTSFPEAWIWMQTNNFSEHYTSFSFSLAKIPWMGKFFIGFIAFLYYNKQFFLFSTYNNSILTEISHNGESVNVTLKNKNSILKVSALKKSFGELRAPVSGDMSRRIKESIDSEVELSLYDKHNNLIYNDLGKRAGLEVIEKIFEYIK